MPPDLNTLSNEQLMALAGGALPRGTPSGRTNLEALPTAELIKLATGGAPRTSRGSSVNDLLGAEASPLQAAARIGVGGLSRFIPFGDEIVAGGSALADRALGRASSVGDAYDQRLGEVRGYQQAFGEQSPLAGAVVDVAGGVALPIKSKVPAIPRTLGKIAQGAKEGAAISALYGLAGGEGVEGRLEGAKDAAIAGGLIGSAFPAVGAVFNRTGKALAKEADKLERSAFGANKTAIKNANKRMPALFDEAGDYRNPISESIKAFRRDGGGKSMEPTKLIGELDRQIKGYAQRLGTVLKSAQQKQRDVIVPEFKFTDDYVSGLSGTDKDIAASFAEKHKALAVNNIDGTLKSIHDEKVKLSKTISDKAWGNDNDAPLKANVLKRIRGDLRRTVEESYAALTGDKNPIVKNLNDQIGKRENLYGLFKDLLATDESQDATKKLIQTIKTTGGFGSLIAAGSLTGGVAGGLAAPILGAAATSPTGRKVLADTARKAAPYASRAGAALQTNGRAFAPLLGRREAKDEQGSTYVEPMKSASRLQQDEGRAALKATNTTKTSAKDRIVNAIISVESGGDPKARSSAGAVGLMQLMPANVRRFGVKDPLDPEENVKAGTKLLIEEMKRFGDLKLALAAYNAGSPKVKAAMNRARSKRFNVIEKYLPRETRDYVAKVMQKIKAEENA